MVGWACPSHAHARRPPPTMAHHGPLSERPSQLQPRRSRGRRWGGRNLRGFQRKTSPGFTDGGNFRPSI